MKKFFTLLCVLLIMFCLALTGCAQNGDKQDSNQTSGSSTTDNSSTENIDKSGEATTPGGIQQVDDDSYADDAAQDLNQDKVIEDSDSQNENMNADSTYSWQVGSSTLTTSINILDYIDGNDWKMKEMASDMGFDAKNAILFWKEDSDVTYRINLETINGQSGASFWTWETESEANLIYFYICDINGSYDNRYFVNGYDKKEVSFEFIVAYAYACEHLLKDPYMNSVDGVLPLRKAPDIYQLG